MASVPLAKTRSLALAAGLAACTSAATDTPTSFPSLDTASQSRRYAVMQQALEKNESGQVSTWTNGDRVRGRVVPIATIRTSLYGWCREYEEQIGTPGANHRLVGIACRTDGQWLVVDIRSYVEHSRQATSVSKQHT
jgi:surface antigen